MSNKYFSGKYGHYIFCDICGQACYTRDAIKLSKATGRGGLIVCPNDADHEDPGLMAYTLPNEKALKRAQRRISNTTNGSDVLDFESTTELGV